jgi:hypothetical protein
MDLLDRSELWGSGYVLSMDIVRWLSMSSVPSHDIFGLPEDWQLFTWLRQGGMDDNYVLNRSAFSEYPNPNLADTKYELRNDVRPFDRWIIVTHPLKSDWMWVETAEYYLSLQW